MPGQKNSSVTGGLDLGSLSRVPGSRMILITSTLFINLLSLALPLALVQIYDRIIPNAAEGTLVLLVVGVGSALVLEAVLRMARAHVSGWIGARFEHLTGTKSIDRMLTADIADFERHGAGTHLERLNALFIIKEFYAGQAVLALCDFPFAIIYLGVIAYLAGVLALVPIVLIAAFSLFALVIGRRLRRSLAKRQIADERRFSFLIEVLGGIHTVKAMAMENQILRRYERLQEASARNEYDVIFDSSSALGIGAVCSQMSTFALIGLGAMLVVDGSLTVGALVACTMLAGRSIQPLQKALGIWTRFQAIRLAREQMEKIFELQPEATPGLPPLPTPYGRIELADVCFGYGRNEDGKELPTIINAASLRIAPGETVAITGDSAGGKSTLLGLMAGLLRPTRGTVRIDGRELGDFDPVSVRSQIAYVPQHSVLFNGTVLENITMFRPQLEEVALETARLIGLEITILRMPLGFDTRVGTGTGDTLGRGIKQRIVVARALVNRPRVLLFDDANAAMDSSGDALLRSVLENLRGQCTMVLVSHRPSLINIADRVYELSGGRLVEREPYAQQLATPVTARTSA
jgi:ATP-binding cassette, subfamily C, bacterial LapB